MTEPMTDAELDAIGKRRHYTAGLGVGVIVSADDWTAIRARIAQDARLLRAAESARDAALARGTAEERTRIAGIAKTWHANAERDRDRAARSGNYIDAGRYDEQARGISLVISSIGPDLPIPTPTQEPGHERN